MSASDKEVRLPAAAHADTVVNPPTIGPSPVVERFHDLANRWKRETRFCSSRTKLVEHPAYRAIIALGPAVLPLILEELKSEPRYWFAALNTITGEDPVPVAERGVVRKMADAWLRWGKDHGF